MQSQEQGIRQQPPLYYIHDLTADPAKTDEVEAYLKDFTAQLKKYSFPFALRVYSTMDFHYYAFIPIKNYSDIDTAKKELGIIGQKMGGDDFQKLIARRSSAIQCHSYFLIRYLPELSHTPTNPRHKPEEEPFRYWVFCYPKPDKEQDIRAVFGKLAALYQRTNLPSREDVYMVELGSDLPLFIYEESGRDIFEFWSWVEKAFTIMGEEGKTLWLKDSMALLRKIERRMGTYRPELSYIPEK